MSADNNDVGSTSRRIKAGAFQCMNLESNLLKAIFSTCHYQQPTPIQRKVIPLVLQGKDVVAMARTGSGKTAAFLIPLLNSLARMQVTMEYCKYEGLRRVRAVVLSPTRELAVQTHRFACRLSRFLTVKPVLMSGGENLDSHFEFITKPSSKDDNGHDMVMLIATPGRFLHVCVEMGIATLPAVRYLVFDEADRLFEDAGFKEQLANLMTRFPKDVDRQTLLFSATMPSQVAEFVRKSITKKDPVLCRLDTEVKLSSDLEVIYLYCPHDQKLSLLCSLFTSGEESHLKKIKISGNQVAVFVPTKYDAELCSELLTRLCGLKCSTVYGSNTMDESTRRVAVDRFRHKKTSVLVATDIAARGIDLPMLDFVVNLNFPHSPKLFIHRAGRVARAGRTGTSISLVCNEEMPYLYDLHTYLGKELGYSGMMVPDQGDRYMIGKTISNARCSEAIANLASPEGGQLGDQFKQARNGHLGYLKTIKPPSREAVNKWKSQKESILVCLKVHPMFKADSSTDILSQIRKWRGDRTIFEIGATADRMDAIKLIKDRRMNQLRNIDRSATGSQDPREATKRRAEGYISYYPEDHNANKALQMDDFHKSLKGSIYDVNPNEDLTEVCSELNRSNRKIKMCWDRQKKKFVSSQKIDAKLMEKKAWMRDVSKRGRFNSWVNKSKGVATLDNTTNHTVEGGRRGGRKTSSGRKQDQKSAGLKSASQIMKQRGIRKAQVDFQRNRRNRKNQHCKRKK